MKLTGGVAADWQGGALSSSFSVTAVERRERERESSEVGYVKRTILCLLKFVTLN